METDAFPLRLRPGLKKAIEEIRGIESINSFINDCVEERLFDEERYDTEIKNYESIIKDVEQKKKHMLVYQKNIIKNLSPIERELILETKDRLSKGKGELIGNFHRFRHQTKNLSVSFALFRKIIDNDLVK